LFYKDTTGPLGFKTYFFLLVLAFNSRGALIAIFFGALSSDNGISMISKPLSIDASN